MASRRILVIRNDKLGDFMLAWPALALLRARVPGVHLAMLVQPYTAPLAEACPYLDEVILDPKEPGEWRNGRRLAQLLKPGRFDAVITLFSRFDTGLAVWLAGIPHRHAPATKLAQVFYNHRLVQRRSRSDKPEFEYNLDLVRSFLRDEGLSPGELPPPPYLHFVDDEVRALHAGFCRKHAIASGTRLLFLHAGHGGSAPNLTPDQYAELSKELVSEGGCHVVLTAGPGEEAQVSRLSLAMTGVPHSIHLSRNGLVDFAKHIQFCDLFISGSTGPLHIAGALNCRTAAFYPRRRSSTALRWQTINTAERRLAFMPPEDAGEREMTAIDVLAAAREIRRRFLK